MATNCTSCGCNKLTCGCNGSYLTTPPACPTPVDCPTAQPCAETFNAQCIYYTATNYMCGEDDVLLQNTSVEESLQAIVDYFCTRLENISSTIVEAGPGISVSEVTVGLTTTYTVSIEDSGWVDLDGFAYYQSAMSTNKPQVRKIGKQVHFRGDLYIPLSSGSAVIPLTDENAYRTVTRKAPWIGTGGVYADASSRLLFNSNGTTAQSVIPISVLPALTTLDGTYKLSRLVATRQIEIITPVIEGSLSGTATLTAPVTIEILSNKTLRVTSLQQLEQNSADIVSFDGNSSLRNITSNYESRDRIINLSNWVNSSRSGLNSKNTSLATQGGLTIGQTYMIVDYNAGDDFTNVGGLNLSGNVFTATGTNPTTWTNLSSLYKLVNVIDVEEEYFYNGTTGAATIFRILSDGTDFDAGISAHLGGFKISLDGLSAYIS